MGKIEINIFRTLIGAALVVCVALFARALLTPEAWVKYPPTNEAVQFSGEYTMDESTERFPWTPETSINNMRLQHLHFYGHFNREIDEGMQFITRSNNLRAQIFVNGEEIFRWGDEASLPSFYKAPGNGWCSFITPRILPEDDVEIILENVYINSSSSLFHAFFDRMSVGSYGENIQLVLSNYAPQVMLYLAIILLGIASLLILLLARVLRFSFDFKFLIFSGFAISASIWLISDFNYITLLIPNPVFCEILTMSAFYCMGTFMTRYVQVLLSQRTASILNPWLFLFPTALLCSLLLQMFGIINMYPLLSIALLIGMLDIMTMLGCLIYESIAFREEGRIQKLLPALLLCLAVLCDILRYFIRFSDATMIVFAWGFLAFLLYHLVALAKTLQRSAEKLRHVDSLERELHQSQISVMLSQIKPHFLFNTLNAISGFCLSNPAKADEAIIALSDYLRGNIQSLEMQSPVPFDQELKHIRNYVNIEMMRFEDRLEVIYDIEFSDFSVPTLSLQTLVENAIRHGVMKLREGGTVLLRTEKEGRNAVITIQDNGVGFTPEVARKSASGIGLLNARKRLTFMVDADFQVKSTPGEGTTITIKIPLKDK